MAKFKNKPQDDEAVERLLKVLEKMDRGDFLPHKDAEKALKVTRAANKDLYYHLIDRTKKRLLAERGIVLWSKSGEGYDLCEAERQLTDVTASRLKRARNQTRKAYNGVEAVKPEELGSVALQASRSMRLQSLRETEAVLESERRAADAMKRKPRDMPRLPRDQD